MRFGFWASLFIAFPIVPTALPQAAPGAVQATPTRQTPTEQIPSEHKSGPNGLEGWTLSGPIDDQSDEKYPFTLILARNGQVIRRIDGDPFVWKWMFLEDGRRVAYESGPLHFSMTCILAEVNTGRKLAAYDCFRELPSKAPAWVKTLEANP
jgi:hypothetical protein